MATWIVRPGWGGAGSAGPFAGSISKFTIETGESGSLSALFIGIGGTLGGPASFTYSDKDTKAYPGPLIVRQGLPLEAKWLKMFTGGLVVTLGTAPRHLMPVGYTPMKGLTPIVGSLNFVRVFL
jgi:hypothetical protein